MVTQDDFVETLRAIEDLQTEEVLYKRYLDFERLDRKIFGAESQFLSYPSTYRALYHS